MAEARRPLCITSPVATSLKMEKRTGQLWEIPTTKKRGRGGGENVEVLVTAADHMGILKCGPLPKLDERHSRKHASPFMSLGLQHEERQDTRAPSETAKGKTHLH